MKRTLLLVGLALTLGAGHARADVITFDGLTGNNGDPFTTYTEGLFKVTPSGSDWEQGFLFGNPIPDIFSGATTSFVDVTLIAGGTFTFSQVDLGNGGTVGSPSFTIEGLLAGSVELTTSGSLASGSDFTTIASPDSNQPIDTLRISFDLGTTTSYNIDNINVTAGAVPEPASLAILASGLVVLGVYRSRGGRARP